MGCINTCAQFFKELATDVHSIKNQGEKDSEIEEMRLESVILRISGVVGVFFSACAAFSALTLLPFSPIAAITTFSIATLIGVASHDAIQVGINEARLLKTLDSTDTQSSFLNQLKDLASRTSVLANAGLSEYKGIPWRFQGTWLFKEIAPLFEN